MRQAPAIQLTAGRGSGRRDRLLNGFYRSPMRPSVVPPAPRTGSKITAVYPQGVGTTIDLPLELTSIDFVRVFEFDDSTMAVLLTCHGPYSRLRQESKARLLKKQPVQTLYDFSNQIVPRACFPDGIT